MKIFLRYLQIVVILALSVVTAIWFGVIPALGWIAALYYCVILCRTNDLIRKGAHMINSCVRKMDETVRSS